MAETKDILTALLKEDLIEAKKIINERLLEKLGNALEEKLVDFAPTVFEEAKELKGKQHKLDKNKNGKIDSEDFKMLRKEDVDINESELTEEDLALMESFQDELASVVESIQSETGRELSESEIEEIANEMLDMISEEQEEDEEEDEDEEEEKTTPKTSSGKTKGPVQGGVDY